MPLADQARPRGSCVQARARESTMTSAHEVSFESLELMPGALRAQGYVCLVSGNHRLTFAAQDVPQKFLDLGIERLFRPPLQRHGDCGSERISSRCGRLGRQRVERSAVISRQLDRLDARVARKSRHKSDSNKIGGGRGPYVA